MNVRSLYHVKRFLALTIVVSIFASRIFLPAGVVHAQGGSSDLFTFSLCPDDSAAEDVGEEQLSMIVTDLGNGEIEIAFANANGAFDSSITDIYLHDPFGLVVDDIVSVEGSDEVNFEQTQTMTINDVTCPVVSPDGPPEALGFVAVDEGAGEASTASLHSRFHNGVNTNEWLKITLKAKPGVTYTQILTALKTGQLKVGIKLLLLLITLLIKYLKCNPHDPGTYIQLATFEADPLNDGVMIRWETAAEVDNAGFNLYRGASIGGPFTKLNGQLLAAQGNGGGAIYEFFDPGGTATAFYQLEDLDYNGSNTLHLPVPVEAAQVFLDHFLFVPLVTIQQ